MTWDKIVVDVVGLGLIGFIVWFFWLVRAKGVRVALTSGGYQEQMVLVKGGYTPDVIVVQAGKTSLQDVNKALKLIPGEKVLGLVMNRQQNLL